MSLTHLPNYITQCAPREPADLRSPLHIVMDGEMFGHKQAIKRALEQSGSYRSLTDEMVEIIVQRRTQRIKELKAEALLLGIHLKD